LESLELAKTLLSKETEILFTLLLSISDQYTINVNGEGKPAFFFGIKYQNKEFDKLWLFGQPSQVPSLFWSPVLSLNKHCFAAHKKQQKTQKNYGFLPIEW